MEGFESRKIQDLLQSATDSLKDKQVASPALDARILLEYVTNMSREELFLKHQSKVSLEVVENYYNLVLQRQNKKPISKIIGFKEFWNSSFIVSNDVLDPRPCSEILVEVAVDHIVNELSGSICFADLGTGSGCLALSILGETTDTYAVGVDKNTKSIEIARQNSLNLNLEQRFDLVCSSWLDAISCEFDFIISNPPYIKSEEIKSLQEDVNSYDPMLALDGGKDGLVSYRYLAETLKVALKRSGKVFLEIGINMETEVIKLFKSNGFIYEFSKKDLSGITRCLCFRLGE